MGLLAHQGGWDEILLVVGPILVIVGLLRLAKKRTTTLGPVPAPVSSIGGDADADVDTDVDVDVDADSHPEPPL